MKLVIGSRTSSSSLAEDQHRSRPTLQHLRTRGSLLLAVLAVGALAAACTPVMAGSTTTTTTTLATTPQQPSISTFNASSVIGTSPALVTFSWTASDANGDALTCRIDGNGDGIDDVTIANCEFGGSRNVSVSLDNSTVAQTVTARLRVEDGNTAEVLATRSFELLPGPTEQFAITLRGLESLPVATQAVFTQSAAKWAQVLTRGVEDFGEVPTDCLPAGTAPISAVDDIVIDLSVVAIDGVGGILGQAGPTCVNLSTDLAIHGIMEFDSADVTALLGNGSFSSVVRHEMAHVLGFGTLWNTTTFGGTRNFTQGVGTGNPRFNGGRSVAEWSQLGGLSTVPLENTGGPGTINSHWKESIFANELMTGYINPGSNPLSRLTIAQFADLGYHVDLTQADPYSVPGLGFLRSAIQSQDVPIEGTMLDPPINTTN